MGKPEPKSPVTEGEVIDGKYRVERVLGVGGMGVVVAATHVQLGQRVALKFLLPHVLAGDQSAARFLREARASVRLKSEHVARVFDVGTLPTGEPYSVMEHLDGCDLATYANDNRPLRIADATEYVLQACEAIVEAHAHGIVHRDLKPQNLFVTRRSNGGTLIKVLDFGISKAVGPLAAGEMSLTDSTIVLGSPLYMAPEQMRSARLADVRSDVWSLGVILYELLTGQVPFDGETLTELCLKVVNEPPPPPRKLRGELPESLARIVTRCLEKDPELRFQNAAMLADALEPFSTSAERGSSDRGWRSLVDTADASDRAGFEPARIASLPASSVVVDEANADKIRTETAWGETRSVPLAVEARPATRGRRTFLGGVAAGIVVTVALGLVTATVLWTRASARDDATAASSTLVATASSVTSPTASARAGTPATEGTLAPIPFAPSGAVTATASNASSNAVDAGAAPSVGVASLRARPKLVSLSPRATSAPATNVAAAPTTAPAAPTVTAVTSPNGAPILH